jgi:hypothetical protein
MPLCRTVLAFVLLAPLVQMAASGAELKTLKGESFKGDLVSVSDKEIVFAKSGGEKVTIPVSQVLKLDLAPLGKINPDAQYSDVELTDGTLLHCSAVLVKGKNVEMTLLLTGQKVTVPMTGVSSILIQAHNDAFRKDWNERLGKKRRRDVLVLFKKADSSINGLEGTLGEGVADGKGIQFALPGKDAVDVPFQSEKVDIHGLIFQHQPDPNMPPTNLKLLDTGRNIIMAASVQSGPNGLVVTTPSGAKLEYALAQVAMLDYSHDKVVYLSDMQPARPPVHNVSAFEEFKGVRHLFLDTSVEGRPLRLKGETYPKGIAAHAYTEIEYDLKGDYREFSAIAGLNDLDLEGRGTVYLVIETDGEKRLELSFSYEDRAKRVQPIRLNIKDVQRLRIIIRSGDEVIDVGHRLDLAEAKVSK